MNSRSCITRSSLACVSIGMLPISSKNSVPLSASSKRPFLAYTAPVKAPFTWPNRFDSSSSCGSEPELTTMKGLSRRGEFWWIAFATSSLPVPLSPETRIVEREGATCEMSWNTCSMRWLLPTSSMKRPWSRSAVRSWRFSSASRRCSRPLARTWSSCWLSKGLGTK